MPQHIPRNLNKPNMFMQLAAKCIDYGVVCGGGGISQLCITLGSGYIRDGIPWSGGPPLNCDGIIINMCMDQIRPGARYVVQGRSAICHLHRRHFAMV